MARNYIDVVAFGPSKRFPEFGNIAIPICVPVTKNGTIYKQFKLDPDRYIPKRYTYLGYKRLNPVWTTDEVVPEWFAYFTESEFVADRARYALHLSDPVQRMTYDEKREYARIDFDRFSNHTDQPDSIQRKQELLALASQRPIPDNDEW